jgi:hypothetical protein
MILRMVEDALMEELCDWRCYSCNSPIGIALTKAPCG